MEVICNTDTTVDINGPGMDAAPVHGRPSFPGRLPASFLGGLARLWSSLTLPRPVPHAELVEVICVADAVIDIPGPDMDALWSAGLCWRRVIRFDAFLGGLERLRSRLPWSRSPSMHRRLPAEPEGVTCADAGMLWM